MMKSLMLPVFVLIFLTGAAQSKNEVTFSVLRMDSITAKGVPIGEATNKEIDKNGGNMYSTDGRLELVFPEGALSKKRKISIQSVSNTAANGRGAAYHLEPSGTKFEKPVTIIFHYHEDELSGTLVNFKSIAGQNKNGKWSMLDNVVVDTINKTIRSKILHFSSYSSFDKILLKPSDARVKVGKVLPMVIQFVTADEPEQQTSNGEDYLPPLPPNIPQPEWTVNGVVHGNNNVGTIQAGTTTVLARYTAPQSVPDENPVAVSAELKGLSFIFNKQTFNDIKLVSNVLIYDKAYRISIDMWVDNSEDGMCTMRAEDNGSFTLVMEGTRSQIKEITNTKLRLRFNPCKCGFNWLDPQNRGPIHIVGASRIDITPASMPSTPFPKVNILLNQVSSPIPKIKTTCPAGGGTPSMIIGGFLPKLIQFEANNKDEQVITLGELSMNSFKNDRRNGLVITIKKIEDE